MSKIGTEIIDPTEVRKKPRIRQERTEQKVHELFKDLTDFLRICLDEDSCPSQKNLSVLDRLSKIDKKVISDAQDAMLCLKQKLQSKELRESFLKAILMLKDGLVTHYGCKNEISNFELSILARICIDEKSEDFLGAVDRKSLAHMLSDYSNSERKIGDFTVPLAGLIKSINDYFDLLNLVHFSQLPPADLYCSSARDNASSRLQVIWEQTHKEGERYDSRTMLSNDQSKIENAATILLNGIEGLGKS